MHQCPRHCINALPEAVEVRLGNQPVKAKWVKVELRKIETIPGPGNRGEEFVDLVGQNPITLWEAKDENETLSSVCCRITFFVIF